MGGRRVLITSGQMGATVGVPQGTTFPLGISSDGRYLTTANGAPFIVRADTAWELQDISLAALPTYLAARKSLGFNTLIVQATNPVKYVASSNAPANTNGDKPFLLNTSGGAWGGTFASHDVAFDSISAAYWSDFASKLVLCRQYGFLVDLDYHYMGFNQGAADGWWQDVATAHNTQSVCAAFGTAIAPYVNYPNILLDQGTDMFPVSASTESNRFGAILTAMKAAGCSQQLVSSHYARSSDARDYADYLANVNVNHVYPGLGGSSYAPPHGRTRASYAKSPAMPCVVVEMKYEGEGSPAYTRLQVRQDLWWSILSCIAGTTFGNTVIANFDTNYAASFFSDGAMDASRLWSVVNALTNWHQLVPHGLGSIGTLVTAGGGSAQTIAGTPGNGDTNDGTDWVAAAATPDGATLVAYVPDAHTGTVTIDMTKLRGTTVQRWYDPTNGVYQSAGSNLPNTGTHAFTVPGTNSDGKNDWVLRLDA